MHQKFLGAAAALLCAVSLAACSETASSEVSSAAPVSSAPVSSAALPVEANKRIGSEIAGVDPIALTNETGKDITGFSVKSSSEEAFPENMLSADDAFAAGETRDLYYAADDSTTSETETGKEVTAQYDVQLTFADGTTAVLHAFPFGDMAEGSHCQEDGVTFLTYLSVSGNQEVNTKDAEQALAETPETAESSEPASSEPAEEAPAAETPAEEQPQQTAPTQTQTPTQQPAPAPEPAPEPEPPPEPEPEPVVSEPAAPTTPDTGTTTPDTNQGGGSDDGCLDDGLLW